MSNRKSIQNTYFGIYEGVASEHPDLEKHPDLKGQDAFKKRVEEILAKRKKDRKDRKDREDARNLKVQRAKRAAAFFTQSEIKPKVNEERYEIEVDETYKIEEENDHEYSMARSELSTILSAAKRLRRKMKGEGNIEAWVQSKITKAADYLDSAADYVDSGEMKVNEEKMTPSDIKREEELKKKYDESGMKESMKKQYGEKWKNVYFGKIRKEAMKESYVEEEYKELPVKKMLRQAGKHKFYAGWVQGEWETNGFNKRKKAPLAKEMVDDANQKAEKIHNVVLSHNPEDAKSKSKYKSVTKEAVALDDVEDEGEQSASKAAMAPNNQTVSTAGKLEELRKRKARMELIKKARQVAASLESMQENYDLLIEAKRTRAERLQANIEKDQKRTRGGPRYDKKGKYLRRGGIHLFDVDETIFSHGVKGKPNVMVHVKGPKGETTRKLTNQQYNEYKLKPGEQYTPDSYKEFGSAEKFAQTSSPNKSVIKKIKRLQKRGQNVQLLSARGKFDNPEAFRQHFSRHGINLKPGDIHLTGGMKGGDVGQKKVRVGKGLAKMHGASSIHMYDDAAKVHNAFEAEKGKSRRLKIKTHLAKPNKRGEVMLRSYQATKSEEFELWVNALIDEGYDLSEFTVDELYETFEYILDEAITAVAAPGGNDKNERPIKKEPKPKIKYNSPYSKDKKHYKEETIELTPYDYWKSIIEAEEELVEEVIEEEIEEVIEKEPTSYEIWKSVSQEQAGSVDRGERHIAHDASMKRRDPNQKTTSIPTASRPGSSPSFNLPISSVPHVHTSKSKV